MKYLCSILGVIILPGIVWSQISSNSIGAAHHYSESSGAGIGMIVWERGKIRFEKYYNGHSANTPVHIYSGTKSFFGVAAAIAVEEGWLDLDEPVSRTLPLWADDPSKKQVTIRHLLNFTSGLESGASQIYSRAGGADKIELATNLKVSRPPGTSFVYGPSHLNAFSAVLNRKLAGKRTTYEKFVRKKVTDRLGIKIARWSTDAKGNAVPSAGMYMTGRNWLKFGQMIVQGGRGKMRQLVATQNLRPCFSGTRINPAFGLCFWLNAYAGQPDARVADVEEWLDRNPMPTDWSRTCLSRSAPPDMIVSLGSNFQRLYMVPSQQLVIVHLGKKGNFKDDEFLTLLFRENKSKPPTKPSPKTTKKKLFPFGR